MRFEHRTAGAEVKLTTTELVKPSYMLQEMNGYIYCNAAYVLRGKRPFEWLGKRPLMSQ